MENRSLLITGLLLVAVLVIGFAFYQYFTGTEKAQTPEETDQNEITYPTITPQEVVDAFLTWYISDDNALPSDAYLTAEALTTNFKNTVTNLVEGPDAPAYDPFVCTEEIPTDEQISIQPAQITGTNANVVVETLIDDTENSFIYELNLVDGAWKVNNVLCFIKG